MCTNMCVAIWWFDKNGERLSGSSLGNEEGRSTVAELSGVWKAPDHESHSCQRDFNLRVPSRDRYNLRWANGASRQKSANFIR